MASAPASGAGGRQFESGHPDHKAHSCNGLARVGYFLISLKWREPASVYSLFSKGVYDAGFRVIRRIYCRQKNSAGQSKDD